MTRFLILITVCIAPFITCAQPAKSESETTWKSNYRATADKINDLVHTKLDVKFDYDKSYLYGKAWITLHPHFYPADSLLLDAKGMELKEVSIIKGTSKSPLKYVYD